MALVTLIDSSSSFNKRAYSNQVLVCHEYLVLQGYRTLGLEKHCASIVGIL